MKEIVSPIIASQRHTFSTFVTTFAAAAIALPIALAFVPNAVKTQHVNADTSPTSTVAVASDPGVGSCTVSAGTSAVKAASSTLQVGTAPSTGTVAVTPLVNVVVPAAVGVTAVDLVHVHDVNVSALNGINALNGVNALTNPNVSVPNTSVLDGVLGGSPINATVNALTGAATGLSLLN